MKLIISEHEPRKGTETLRDGSLSIPLSDFRTRTPKGDGNGDDIVSLVHEVLISEHEPRKGTETWNRLEDGLITEEISEHEPRKGTETSRYKADSGGLTHFRTRTPKGDGNYSQEDGTSCKSKISEHEPRKGTETVPVPSESHLPMRISEHEPRKGTETRE